MTPDALRHRLVAVGEAVRDDVLVEESPPGGYAASPSTEGVEKGVAPDGDDPMIGGGSR